MEGLDIEGRLGELLPRLSQGYPGALRAFPDPLVGLPSSQTGRFDQRLQMGLPPLRDLLLPGERLLPGLDLCLPEALEVFLVGIPLRALPLRRNLGHGSPP